MSIKIMTNVWEHSPYKGTKLLVLLALADYANHEGMCFPSYDTIADKARISRRYAIDLVGELISEGVLEKTTRYHEEFGNRSNLYQFLMYVNGGGGEQPITRGSEPPITKVVNSSSPRVVNSSSPKPSLRTVNEASSLTAQDDADWVGEVFDIYRNNINASMSPMEADDILGVCDDIPEKQRVEWFREAVGRAVYANVRKWSYVRAILFGWIKSGHMSDWKSRDEADFMAKWSGS